MSARLAVVPRFIAPAIVDTNAQPELCWFCGKPATLRCSSHEMSSCGSRHCIAMHRLGEGWCEMLPYPEPVLKPMDWIDWSVWIVGLFLAGVAVVMVVVHRGGVK